MPVPRMLELTPEEQALLDQVSFEPPYEDSEAASLLMQSLLARGAIPQVRLQFLTDPYFWLRSGKSLLEQLRSGGMSDSEVWAYGGF
jgi:hypothetical protein